MKIWSQSRRGWWRTSLADLRRMHDSLAFYRRALRAKYPWRSDYSLSEARRYSELHRLALRAAGKILP